MHVRALASSPARIGQELLRAGVGMTNRRLDAIYFLVLLAVAAIGYLLSGGFSDDPAGSIDDAFFASADADALVLPEPFVELPEPFWVFRRSPARQAPATRGSGFADPVEKALSRVRNELLVERAEFEAPAVSTVERRPVAPPLPSERLAAIVE